MTEKVSDILIQLYNFSVQRHYNALMPRKKLSNVLIDDSLAVLRMIKVIFNQAVFTDEALVFSAKFRGDLFGMAVAKYHW
jgi:hypothetical protein